MVKDVLARHKNRWHRAGIGNEQPRQMIAHDRIRLIGLLIFYFEIQVKTKMMYSILAVFPVPNMNKTADFYVKKIGIQMCGVHRFIRAAYVFVQR